MRMLREVLRLLWHQGHSAREVARSLGLSHSTVLEYARRARDASLSWPLPGLDDAALEASLFPPPPPGAAARLAPDYERVHCELRRQGVTRHLVWLEFRAAHPDGIGYSKFCEGVRAWRQLQGLSMRQTHLAGEKVFVDYAGHTLSVVSLETGEVRDAQVFVGALGASQYAYVEATWSQGLEDWIASHVRMLTFYGGCPRVIVPDNLKVGVTRADRYEPLVNATYQEFAAHYDLSIMPARAGKPQDKAVAESAVQVAERWILARLRDRTLFGLSEANDAIWELLSEFNNKPFQKRPGSRHSEYLDLDRPALRPLPRERYVFARWKLVRPHVDYHVTIDQHHYSVPHALVGQQLEARVSSSTIEVFHRARRVASHARSSRKGGFTTVREHMPAAHQAHAGMTPERLTAWAASIGTHTKALIEGIIERRQQPYQAVRSCLGVLRLGKTHGEDRLEAACGRAVALGSYAFKSIEAILKNGLDQQPLPTKPPTPLPTTRHANVRGSSYYATTPNTNDDTTARQNGSEPC